MTKGSRWLRDTLTGCAVVSLLSTAATSVRAQAPGPRKLLYAADTAGTGKLALFAMNPDGSGQTPLGKSELSEFDPVLSPDGKLIAFTAVAAEARGYLYVMNADGTGRRKVSEVEGLAFAPAWSPDGKRLAFSAAGIGEAGPENIRLLVVDVDGGNLQQLGRDRALPAWSPDGKKIVFTIANNMSVQGLGAIDPDGTNARELVNGVAMMAAWAPDGKRIAYLSEGEGGEPDLFVMNADGSGRTQLTATKEFELAPQWSGDGKQLFYVRMPGGIPAPAGAEIHVMNAEGGGDRELTTNNTPELLAGGGILMLLFTRRQ